jgi:hypothetical protein
MAFILFAVQHFNSDICLKGYATKMTYKIF